MKRLAGYLIAFAAAAMLAGCNVSETIKAAEAEVGHFHKDLDSENWQAIWKSADPEFRKTTQRAQFERLLGTVHDKLGKVKSSKQVGWNANATTGGSFVTITTQTTFERGEGTERFVFRDGEADTLTLVGYNIQSQDMMLD